MSSLRVFVKQHRKLALMLAVLSLCIKAVIPAGFMVSVSKNTFLTVTICSDATGKPAVMKLVIPGKSHDNEHPDSAGKKEHCAFSGLAQPALGGVDDILLAIALAIILILSLRPAAFAVFAECGRLRPPLRGPPALV